jgi:pentatricopeptide repeat protein
MQQNGETYNQQVDMAERPPMHQGNGQWKASERKNSRGGNRGGRNAGSPLQNIPTPSRARARGSGGGEAATEKNNNSGGATPGSTGEQRRPRGAAANALEDLLRRSGIDEAWGALEEMQREGTLVDKYTVSRMLMKTVGNGNTRLASARVYRGIAAVERFIELQPTDVDEVLFNALLDTCCRLKDMGRLEQLVQRMRQLKVTPSPVTLGILVKSYGQAGDLPRVLNVWDEMALQRDQANAVTYGCMIDACVKCGRLDKAVEVFEGMRKTGKHKNTILYTTLIKGHGREKDLKRALELFYEMPREGVPYNTITYNSIIDAATKAGDLPTAERLLREMASPQSELQPDLITFSTLLKGYCHAGELDKALQVIEAIKSRGLICDELVYNTLMEGCVKANDTSAGVGLFEEMVTSGLRPSNITYSILARLYSRGGYEENASEAVAQLCAQHGLERPHGVGSGGGGGAGKGGTSWKRGGEWSTNPRSPGGQSPISLQGAFNAGQRERSDSFWSMSAWGDAGVFSGYEFNDNCSVASTPMGSPAAANMNMGNGYNLFGMSDGSCTPMGDGSCTPMSMSGGMSMTAGPQFPTGCGCASPVDQRNQGPPSFFGMPASPAGPQQGCPMGGSMPSLTWSPQAGAACPRPCGASSPCSSYALPLPGQFNPAGMATGFTGPFLQAGDATAAGCFQQMPPSQQQQQQQHQMFASVPLLPGTTAPSCCPPPPPFGNPAVPEMNAMPPPQVPFLPPAEMPALTMGEAEFKGSPYREPPPGSPSTADW